MSPFDFCALLALLRPYGLSFFVHQFLELLITRRTPDDDISIWPVYLSAAMRPLSWIHCFYSPNVDHIIETYYFYRGIQTTLRMFSIFRLYDLTYI